MTCTDFECFVEFDQFVMSNLVLTLRGSLLAVTVKGKLLAGVYEVLRVVLRQFGLLYSF